jgi:ADP-heptose:LPS heptosyltransferase
VLLVHPGALGDLVQALPAFGALRAGLPGARITLLTDAALAGFARDLGLFDAVEGFDAETAYRGGLVRRLALVAALAARLRRLRPDATAVFKGAAVYPLLAAASGAGWRVGLARGAGRRALHRPIAVDPARHHEDRYLDVAAALGVDPTRRAAARWPGRGDVVPAEFRAGARPLVGIAPGGARNAKQDTPTKRWPAARFAEVAAGLAARHAHARFVLLGGPGDRAEVDAVRAALPAARTLDLAGRTDLAAARAAIAALDLYLGNDSGLMHVAATTATPAVIPFGPTDPRVIAPRAPGVRVVWDPAPAPPCFDEVTGAHRACATPCCIDRVSAAAVLAAAESALAERAATASR